MSATAPRPLGEVLTRAFCDFVPEHPERPPWHRTSLRRVDHAYTGNVAVVALKFADRAQLRGLGDASWDQDWLEPTDWMLLGWGVLRR